MKELRRLLGEVNETREKVEAERRSLRRVSLEGKGDLQKSTRTEKEMVMLPPTQTVSGQPVVDLEDGESQDFDHLAKLERMKCRINSIKRLQVCDFRSASLLTFRSQSIRRSFRSWRS